MLSRIQPLLLGGFDVPTGRKRLLQIGPGIGQLTQQLLVWGWEVHCLECGKWVSGYLEEAYPLATVHRGTWEDWEAPFQFDAITGNHSLEHLVEADICLDKIFSSLVSGGRIYQEVPAVLFDDGTLNDHAWINGLHNHDHWWHFSERSLRNWFEGAGFVDVRFSNTVRDYEENKLMDYHVVGVKPLQ
jgi:predicted SAM-dependent methyltransferase